MFLRVVAFETGRVLCRDNLAQALHGGAAQPDVQLSSADNFVPHTYLGSEDMNPYRSGPQVDCNREKRC